MEQVEKPMKKAPPWRRVANAVSHRVFPSKQYSDSEEEIPPPSLLAARLKQGRREKLAAGVALKGVETPFWVFCTVALPDSRPIRPYFRYVFGRCRALRAQCAPS